MDSKSIGIYIHIPFCMRKCGYCDFPSFTDRNIIDDYFNALKTEIAAEKATAGKITDTIYIGGGTPSCVPPLFISKILEEIGKKYVIDPGAEISIEMNPGTVVKENLEIYRAAGVNRISLGCQSFNDRSLNLLKRIHSAHDVIKTFELLRKCGFDNINLDLISAIPGERMADLEHSIRMAADLEPEHLSVYSLFIEPETEFYDMEKKGELGELPSEEEQAEMDDMVRSVTEENNFMRYEISNYAKKGHECKHNVRYWTRAEYRGFGLSAASLVKNRRFANTRELVYINDPGGLLSEDRLLSREEEMQEFMFLGLRMIKGVSSSDFRMRFGQNIEEVFGSQLEKQRRSGFLEYDGDRYRYNTKGLNVSNILMSEFL